MSVESSCNRVGVSDYCPSSRDTAAHRPAGSVVLCGGILHVIRFSLGPRKHCASLTSGSAQERDLLRASHDMFCDQKGPFFQKGNVIRKKLGRSWIPSWDLSVFSLKGLMDSCEEKHFKGGAGWSGLPAPSVPDARSGWQGSQCAVPLPQHSCPKGTF